MEKLVSSSAYLLPGLIKLNIKSGLKTDDVIYNDIETLISFTWKIICDEFKVSNDLIFVNPKLRKREFVIPKQVLCYVLEPIRIKYFNNRGFQRMVEQFFQKGHPFYIHSLRKISGYMEIYGEKWEHYNKVKNIQNDLKEFMDNCQ